VFPETPAQAKRREDKERRNLRAGRTTTTTVTASASNGSTATGRTRILPEIEIVEDDDPRIIFPPNGQATRVQTTHEHVIRSHYGDRRLDTTGPTRLLDPPGMLSIGSRGYGYGRERGEPRDDRDPTRDRGDLDSSSRSVSVAYDSNKATSAIIAETGGGYLPSRWASGDRQLRVTEEQKERYRPTEWGGRHGDLGGRAEEWR
jgi:hypothetical protein